MRSTPPTSIRCLYTVRKSPSSHELVACRKLQELTAPPRRPDLHPQRCWWTFILWNFYNAGLLPPSLVICIQPDNLHRQVLSDLSSSRNWMHRRDTTLFAFRGQSVNIRSLGQATKQYFGKSRHCCTLITHCTIKRTGSLVRLQWVSLISWTMLPAFPSEVPAATKPGDIACRSMASYVPQRARNTTPNFAFLHTRELQV